MINKEKILAQAKKHLTNVCIGIKNGLKETKKVLKISTEKFSGLSYAEQMVESGIIAYSKKRIDELGHLEGSPYFVRCDVIFNKNEKEKSIYFAKFGFDKKSIYSWIAPASMMRFENPGDVSYRRPDGVVQKVELLRKDQYMIVDGKIKFLSSESINSPRELVYEEYFSTQKSGFILPEIVAQMEKAQDQVIRAYHVGPFLISGPAGSGKTTLALHRVAYLVQAPDLAHIYTRDTIIIFVQDNGTREYFSHLLPELGIDDVLITTFSEWAFKILEINEDFVDRYGDSEYEKDLYEFNKLKALNNLPKNIYARGGSFSLLENVYRNFLVTKKQKALFQRQVKERVYDRIDLTLLLKIFFQNDGKLTVAKEGYVEQKNGKVKKKLEVEQLEYSLVVVDEFQNYLPDQLKFIKSCINKKSRSIVYVGDMAQQVKLGTIRQWEDMGEEMGGERAVILEKVYRNTKNILLFIKKLGYNIEVPAQLKEGATVGEYIFETKKDEVEKIKELIQQNNFGSMGILAKESEYLVEFKKAFAENKKVHVMTMNEAQGVEFDIVILVGIGSGTFVSYDKNVQSELVEEKKKINKDLLYVALTRAISQLHIMGKDKLENVIK
ncbi:MAG: hypothetical protein ACD_7C00016G0004 [uncultured bacterium]|nr:MAG: hypothetical protein ACD_7C00016G0004 [uncultured bacterium]HBR79183.1 hypothetical protein [Candidatus Moranbacteria bacterium]